MPVYLALPLHLLLPLPLFILIDFGICRREWECDRTECLAEGWQYKVKGALNCNQESSRYFDCHGLGQPDESKQRAEQCGNSPTQPAARRRWRQEKERSSLKLVQTKTAVVFKVTKESSSGNGTPEVADDTCETEQSGRWVISDS